MKSSLLLAFGNHQGSFRGVKLPADIGFFRRCSEDFLREEISRGSKVVAIHEYFCSPPKIPDLLSLNNRRRAISGVIKKNEKKINRIFRETLDMGFEVPEELKQLDVGIFDSIAEANSGEQRVWNIIEYQSEKLYRSIIGHLAGLMSISDPLELEMAKILTSIGICNVRDHLLADQATRIALENPGVSILITRGFAHRGMVKFFDADLFEIDLNLSPDCVPAYSTEAIDYFYNNGEIDIENLERLARLTIEHRKFMETEWESGAISRYRENDREVYGVQLLERAGKMLLSDI